MQKQTPSRPIFKRTLLSWALSGNAHLQLTLLLIILLTVVTRVLPLEMQKRVVNEAIKLGKIKLLLTYCGIYLLAVVMSGGLKYVINILQTVIAQRTLTRMRKALYNHILTLPLNFFRKTQPGMVVASLVTEMAAAGEFAGMAIAVPLTNVLTLAAFAGYLFWLNPLLAGVSLSIYPLVLFLIPFLQQKANQANKQRVDATRLLSGKIAESISGIHEIQGHGAYSQEGYKLGQLVERLEAIRVKWNLFRYGIKASNNFFVNLAPFLIFLLGGYLTINGRLELGALVAFLSAQEKIYDPWKDLIDFYQSYQDASIRYKRTMEAFSLSPEFEIAPAARPPYALNGNIQVKQLAYTTDDDIRILHDINFNLEAGQSLALIGFSGSGKSTLVQCIAQLYKYSQGTVRIDGREITSLSRRDMVENIGYVSQQPFIFEGTLEENLLYPHTYEEEGHRRPNLDDMIEVLQQTDMFVDVLRFGLNSVLTEDTKSLIPALIDIRHHFRHHFGQFMEEDIEFFDTDKYLYYSSVYENIVFGTPNTPAFMEVHLLENDFFLNFLRMTQLFLPLVALGRLLAAQTIDILGDLPPDALFFRESPIPAADIDRFREVLYRAGDNPMQLNDDDQHQLLVLGLKFTPGIHKMVALPKPLEALLLKGRAQFRDQVDHEHPEAFLFYTMNHYMPSQSIINNILFGKPKQSDTLFHQRIRQNIIQLLIEANLLEKILKNGMQYQVGTKGDNLSGGQRQKLAIARAFIKRPRILILDEATSALDNKAQARIQNIIDTQLKGRCTILAVIHRLDIIHNYDQIAVMKAGKIIEMGNYAQLLSMKGTFYELATGNQGHGRGE